MAQMPIFVATHPRACSTAFERVYMALPELLECVHEPFGDAYYYGPERLSERYENDEDTRIQSGFSKTTFKDVLDRIMERGTKSGKRIFIKDMAHYLFPPHQKSAKIAPSFGGVEEPANPTVMPKEKLSDFMFTFLIRHPRSSIPSYYRCTQPPLAEMTGFDEFLPCEAGYEELRRLFDYLIKEGIVTKENIIVLDADDMLDRPEEAIRAFSERVGIPFSSRMLNWTEEDGKRATTAFAKWRGFHEDALDSNSLRARTHARKTPTVEEENAQWTSKFGEKGQKIIRSAVDENIDHYEYLKSYSLKF